MTIEEKARTYDEALNRCKEWASGTWGHSVDDSPKDIAKFIFPQLAESEDERTRKALINYFKAHSSLVGENWNGIECDDVVAYLEKQKDASKAIEAVERIDKYIDQHLANAHDMKDSNPDKKYYRGWDDALGKMAGILQDVYSGEKQKESLRDFIDDFPYSCEQEKPENISASTMIPSFHEELTEFELVLFNAVLDNNFVGAKGSENALAMTKKVAPELLAIAKKEPNWDKEKCFVCQEYEKGFKQGHLEGCTAGYNKAMKEVNEQKEPHFTKRNALFDKCVENCDPKTVEEVNKRVDDIMNMPELSAFEQALTNFIGYWEDDEERWPSKFVKKHGKHILDMAREELQKEQKPVQSDVEKEYVRTLKSLISDFLRGKEEVDREYYQQIFDWLDGRHIEQKPVECIDFDNEFENQVSHLLASVLNGEHEYNESFVKYAAQSLLGYAKNEMKPDEWDKREKLFTKALQTANAQIGQLFEENKKLKEQQPTEIDEYKIIKKHITEDSLSSEVNKRLKECGWYVTDTESSEWSEDDEKDIAHIIRVLDDCYAYGKHDLSKTDHENLVNTLKSIHPQLKSEWSEEDEGELQNAIDALEFLGKKGTYKSESGYDVALKAASWLKSLPERFNPQPKQEWSEEDEKIINTIISLLGQYIDYKSVSGNSSGYAAPRYGREIDWLKSLRPQPKQEWSEEDERIIDTIVSVLGQYIDYKIVSGTGSGYATPRYNKEIAWLKSLPLDLKKKNEDVAKLCSNEWNEEDEEKLKAICTYLRDYSRLVKLGDKLRFNEYCDFLESLRPQGSKDSLQTHWKPSEEQMNALLKVVYKARELHYTSIDGYTGYNDLRSLYEQLKKLM